MSEVVTMYDPPEGWKYGFPKEYKPLENESLGETLFRDGYPKRLIKFGIIKYCRFWNTRLPEKEGNGG